MPIIMAHPSVPWQDEALSVAVHKPQGEDHREHRSSALTPTAATSR
jgi:hypothetical protein